MTRNPHGDNEALPPHIEVKAATSFVGLPGFSLVEATFRFSPELRIEIEQCYAKRKPVSTMDAFIRELEQHLGAYQVLAAQDRELSKQKKEHHSKLSAEATVRKKLQESEARIQAVLEIVEDLVNDREACLRLYAACQVGLTQEAEVAALQSPNYAGVIPGSLTERVENARSSLNSMRDVVTLALTISGASPAGGRPTKPLPGALAIQLAESVSTHFGTRPTATRGGPFEQLVTLCFRAVGWYQADIHELLVSILREKQGGKTAPRA